MQPGKVERHSASFWREADMLGSLNHPNVLRFYGAVVVGREDPSVIGIMTEFMRGGSLAQFLRCACSSVRTGLSARWQGRCTAQMLLYSTNVLGEMLERKC